MTALDTAARGGLGSRLELVPFLDDTVRGVFSWETFRHYALASVLALLSGIRTPPSPEYLNPRASHFAPWAAPA